MKVVQRRLEPVLVSFLVAAKMTHARPDNFYIKYVRTGRLKPVLNGKRRSECYFSLEDVEEIINLTEQTITASKVAAICKTNESCIHKLTVAGELKPISGPNVDGFGHNLYLRTDVERFHAEREAFKGKRANEGGASRYGRPAGPKRQPVRNKIESRLRQLIKRWSAKTRNQPITGTHDSPHVAHDHSVER
jgi:hypothetical protein